MRLSLVIDGIMVLSNSDSTANIRTTFDEIAFGDGFVASPANFAIDNVQVTSSVPEPASAALLLLGGCAMVGSRRGRRS